MNNCKIIGVYICIILLLLMTGGAQAAMFYHSFQLYENDDPWSAGEEDSQISGSFLYDDSSNLISNVDIVNTHSYSEAGYFEATRSSYHPAGPYRDYDYIEFDCWGPCHRDHINPHDQSVSLFLPTGIALTDVGTSEITGTWFASFGPNLEYEGSMTTTLVPLPATLMLFGSGLISLMFGVYRKGKRAIWSGPRNS